MANWRVAPPPSSRILRSAGTPSRLRSSSMVSLCMFSYMPPRWLVSIMDRPCPWVSTISSRIFSSTGTGSVEGPA